MLSIFKSVSEKGRILYRISLGLALAGTSLLLINLLNDTTIWVFIFNQLRLVNNELLFTTPFITKCLDLGLLGLGIFGVFYGSSLVVYYIIGYIKLFASKEQITIIIAMLFFFVITGILVFILKAPTQPSDHNYLFVG